MVRALAGLLALAGFFVFPTGWASAQEAVEVELESDPELRFIRGLRDRGYFDLALEYIQELQDSPKTNPDLKPVLDYEVGRGLLDEATQSADLENRFVLLEKARVKLDEFTKSFPDHALTPEALVQLARLFVERGHTSMLQGQELEGAAREAKLVEARGAFAEARKAYDQAEGPIQKVYDSFPKFIPDGDPRRQARDRAHTALMEDQLQRAIVDYEEAQTYDLGSKERAELLDEALEQFEDLYKRYRTQLSGLYARMLQGKSYEEKGELGSAMGIYNELMDHSDPRLRDMQRKVGYFRIIVLGKRGEYPLAVDEAARWLQANPGFHSTEDGLGVQLEMAKDLIAMLPTLNEKEQSDARARITDRLTRVVRFYSPHKAEALKLLQEYQPKAAGRLNVIAGLSYDDAMSQADTAISTEDWPLARALLNQAIRRALQAEEMEKVNRARYFLCFCEYSDGRYYASAILAEHLARHYPEGGLSAKATEIGLAAWVMAYNTYTSVDRLSDLDRMVDLAEYTVETWPDTDQGDAARVTLGEVALGRGHYAEAAQWLTAVRPQSSRRLDAQVKAGDAHWRNAQQLRSEGKTAEADDEAKTAEDLIASALKARDEARASLTAPARMTNANALAEILRANGQPEEAVTLLEPVAEALQKAKPSAEILPLYAATLSILVRSQLAIGQSDQAIASMKILEGVSPSPAALTQLYFELGRSLKEELDALEEKGDIAGQQKTRDSYQQFLNALAQSAAGQSYDSLQWAGEAMLDLGIPKDADAVFRRVLQTYSQDSDFQKLPDASDRLLRTRLKLVASLREQGLFPEAHELVQELVDEHPKLLDPRMEKGLILEAKARAENSRADWMASLDYWKTLGLQLRGMRQKPVEYYDAWYHAAFALFSLGNKAEATATLKGIMVLNPSLGGPEMKAKYEDLLRRING